MSKTASQENFPVASRLFMKKQRGIIMHYYNFARYCDDIADSPDKNSDEKLAQLDLAMQALYGQASSQCTDLLRADFLAENLDFALAADLLTAFRRDAVNTHYQTWAQLLDYCRYSAVPVGRFMLALFNENPSTYMPAAALCSVLQIVNHLQDMKEDALKLKRIYIPQELFDKYKVSAKAVSAPHSSKNLHFLINDVLKRCDGLLQDAAVLPSILQSRRLKVYICVTLALTKILIRKMQHTDILKQKVKLTFIDKVAGTIKGIIASVVIRRKTLTYKGL